LGSWILFGGVQRRSIKIMFCAGVNIGALSVKTVALDGERKAARVALHCGRPLETLQAMLAQSDFAGVEYFGVSGQLGHLTEVAAIRRALRELEEDYDAVASLGGEAFLVYFLTRGRITNVLSHNKCAAGSGEFFVQQIGRMGLGMEAAIQLSLQGKVVPLASRCSVHCKSDITHKLNRNEAAPADILHTLHDSMANKVVALLEKGQRPRRRVLLIGGVSRNAAMLASLRAKLPETEFTVRPESAWFEAWGTALLTRDKPIYKSPKLSVPQRLGRLPPLFSFADQVRIIPAPPRQLPPDGPMALGVDAGSTTTKAVLLDPATGGVVASHYLRTQGDPVASLRACLRALADQVGNRRIGLIATTGSAREIAGAYLGTAYVFNEISAHAAGARHFDQEVDTIMEIGGQDSKYIHLRNGVPIDYAMNNACSAGTGSFLEESAKSDLGVAVSEISSVALAASSPVHFKATCAAFINSDIRAAQQQGLSHDDIVAGLVYAIAANYLTKVKGPRCVGRKVFLQGGVALNRALGHAFAHQVGRPVVIPPNPELLGALGVALLALSRSQGRADSAGELRALAAPELERVGRFTCRACKLYCDIDRFQVGGRVFPFGGRCSLYENVWKRKSRAAAAPDLVEERTSLLFDPKSGAPPNPDRRIGIPKKLFPAAVIDRRYRAGTGRRVGIPKALLTHSLHPLYSTFFHELGIETVLSGVDPQGELKSNAGFCFPVQIAHGAVLDLARRGVNQIFLPQVMHMPQPNACGDCYLCPITQASPSFLAKAFPDQQFLSPLLDFSKGYGVCSAIVEMAVGELGMPRELAASAWTAAVRAQEEAESALLALGRKTLGEAVAHGKLAILLAGHSYSAFAPEASQSVARKLSSMGVTVIPGDCLTQAEAGPTAWHFANQILNAAAIAKKHPNLFLLCVSNFSCTIDAFTQSILASVMGSKPHLILEIDAHTADAGIQTRLEAFLDIAANYQSALNPSPNLNLNPNLNPNPARPIRPFTACQLLSGGRIVRSNGESVQLDDPRVKIRFPNFSQYHSESLAQAARWLGLHVGETVPLDRKQLDRGLEHTSGRECLPLPICIGQLLHVSEHRPPGEITGFYMVRGGAPCVSDCYMGYFERFIAEQQLPDLFLLNPAPQNGWCGLDRMALVQSVSPAIQMADILVEIEQVLGAVGLPGSVDQLRAQWRRFLEEARSLDQFNAQLPALADWLEALPRRRDPSTCPKVVITGDFFTRFSPFFMEGVHELYAASGIILKPVDLGDLVQYTAYHNVAGTASVWGMKPGYPALAKACLRMFHPDGKQYLRQWMSYRAERWLEGRYRQIFRKTGLLVAGPNNVSSLFETASRHISPAIFGEVIPSVGKGLEAANEGYDGIFLIGPFNCLPFRISEAILKPLTLQADMPLLTYESDGYAVSPSFLRQVEVHIEQVLERSGHRNQEMAPIHPTMPGSASPAGRR
jgi:predicted CoA-substrate-specific enzyme activase